MNERVRRWNQRYLEEDLPWDTGRHDHALARTITEYGIAPCRALDIGCGHGSNAIWLAEQGFDVDGTDISPKAVEVAAARSAKLGLDVHFEAGDALADPPPRRHYGLVFDRGCFHSFEDPAEQETFARNIRKAIADDGWWLSLIGNADDTERTEGPPKRTARQIVGIIEPLFEIYLLRSIHFDSDRDARPRAWACLARPRAS